MEKDVVCGMQVDPAKAAGTSQYDGKTYHFCSKGCKSAAHRDQQAEQQATGSSTSAGADSGVAVSVA